MSKVLPLLTPWRRKRANGGRWFLPDTVVSFFVKVAKKVFVILFVKMHKLSFRLLLYYGNKMNILLC